MTFIWFDRKDIAFFWFDVVPPFLIAQILDSFHFIWHIAFISWHVEQNAREEINLLNLEPAPRLSCNGRRYQKPLDITGQNLKTYKSLEFGWHLVSLY